MADGCGMVGFAWQSPYLWPPWWKKRKKKERKKCRVMRPNPETRVQKGENPKTQQRLLSFQLFVSFQTHTHSTTYAVASCLLQPFHPSTTVLRRPPSSREPSLLICLVCSLFCLLILLLKSLFLSPFSFLFFFLFYVVTFLSISFFLLFFPLLLFP